MKTERFLFVVIGIGALTLGRSFADEPSRLFAEQGARDKDTVSVRPAEPVHGGGVQANRTHSLLNSNGNVPERSSQAGPLNEIHQPTFKKAPAAANQGLMMNKIAKHYEEPARLPIGSGTAPALPGVVHGRSTGAATLGGIMASSAKNSAGVIDGAVLKRKP